MKNIAKKSHPILTTKSLIDNFRLIHLAIIQQISTEIPEYHINEWRPKLNQRRREKNFTEMCSERAMSN